MDWNRSSHALKISDQTRTNKKLKILDQFGLIDPLTVEARTWRSLIRRWLYFEGDFGDFGDNDPARQQQQHADAVVDQSRDATRRMLSMIQETEETGAKTMEMLDEQGEQLNRIEEGIEFNKKYNILEYFYYF